MAVLTQTVTTETAINWEELDRFCQEWRLD